MDTPNLAPHYPTSPPRPPSPAPLPDKLHKQYANSPLANLLGHLPRSVKEVGSRLVDRYRKLSTTQKVVGGLLVAVAVRRLMRSRPSEASTLHELLHFVNDRVAGYQKAVEESRDPQRRGYYQRLVSQSQQFAQALNEYLRRLGGGHEASTTLKGKLYRRFMAAAVVVTGYDEQTVLASNIHGEQWAITAYEAALGDKTLRGPLRQEVARQYHQSQQTYQELKRLAA